MMLFLLGAATLVHSQETSLPPATKPKGPPKVLNVFPTDVHLFGSRDEHFVGVIGTWSDGREWDLSRDAKFTSSDPKIAVVDAHGLIQPVADGTATITIQAEGLTKKLPVKVTGTTMDTPVGFTREVVPILTRAGCNQGSCHGAQHGRGGFRLSLLGFDAAFDHAQIVESAEGRRVVVNDAERSILLQKPVLTMEHAGGERFKIGSRSYLRLKNWLEDGAPSPSSKDPEVTSIQVWPAKRTMVPGEQQQLLVQAVWKDGKVEDVTATAQFDTLNDGVANVTPSGLVTAKARGETHIMIRFCGQATVAQITLPYAKVDPYPEVTAANFIDQKLIAKWKELGLTPSGNCSDAEFLRRVYLDLIGTLPRPEEVKEFLADASADKRAKLVDKVMDRPEFVDYWAYKWGDLLRINRKALNERGMWSFHNWVRASLRDRRPMDEMVRDIITAEGSTYTEGPANYFMVARTPADWAETTSQLFLGVRIGCAKCHHHPFEKWSQDDYYGMAAFFVRLGTKNSQEFGLFGREQVVYLKSTGEQSHPRKGGVVKPHPLDAGDMDDPIDRRVKLAEWMTRPDNPFFARNIVNRFWGYVMGRGLVEPLDDMRATNPASNPELLDALAQDFVKNKYDLRHLLRTIMNSRAYQLSSVSTDGNKADVANTHYSRFTIRRLAAEQLADAVDTITGTQTKYPGLPLGTKAIQLPDTEVKSFFLDTFGRPPRQITCECERTSQPNIAQALHLMNNDELNKRIADPKGRIEKLIAAKKSMPAAIEELYLVALSRMPTAEEMERAKHWVSQAPNVKEGLQDTLWVLLNSKEFLFQH
jgi:hypothetical protein